MFPITHDQARALLRQWYEAAVQAALPAHTLAQHLPRPPKGRTVVVGAGKAAAAMAYAVEADWDLRAPLSGLVVTRYGHTPPRPAGVMARIDVAEAAHPVPDAAGLAAAERIMGLLHGLSKDDLVICLVSGGGSSLLTLPIEGLSLQDKQRINQELLHSGASISEMNTVRKHLSRIKGGQLARACQPARLVTLAISDVPGDDMSVIGSGPTVADPSSCGDALAVLQRYAISVPEPVVQRLRLEELETPKPGDPCFSGQLVHLIATPQQSLEAAARAARLAGIEAHILSDEIEGESREVGLVHAALARSVALGRSAFQKPCVLLSGGETTVSIRQQPQGQPLGRGGRAGEFCMGLAQGLRGIGNVYGLAADTDGIDGVNDNAGAIVEPDTLARAAAMGLGLADHLDRHDAVGFFGPLSSLVTTGPTYTNVNDFRAILVL